MRTFAEKPKTTQQASSAKTTMPGRAHFEPNRDVNSILHLQRTIGNQAVQRMLQTDAGNLQAHSTNSGPTGFGHDFSRVPVYPKMPVKPRLTSFRLTPFDTSSNPTVPHSDAVAKGSRGCMPVATQTSVVSQDGEFVTETTNGGATPAAPAATNYCAVTSATFATVPSGTITAALNGSKLEGPFQIRADFDTPIPCTCSCGEYRQYVRGTFTANGRPVTHQLGPGRVLHPTTFQEDGDLGLGTAYGYRSLLGTKSRFKPDQAGGCRFESEDEPGIRASSGASVAMNLDFRGDLIDTCSGNSVVTSASWSVAGSATIP